MPRWIIHELFAHIPECHGYLPLSIGFAQFVAVKCDQDPLDQVLLSAELAQSSCTQEVMRWFIRLLQSGEISCASRPVGGGPVVPVSRNHWHADDMIDRFITSRYCRTDPFRPEAPRDDWIFLDEEEYLVLWEVEKKRSLGIAEPRPKTPRRNASAKDPSGTQSDGSQMLGLPAVEALVGLRRSTIYKMVEERRFPSQVKVGNRSLWRRSEVAHWVEKVGTSKAGAPKVLPRMTSETPAVSAHGLP